MSDTRTLEQSEIDNINAQWNLENRKESVEMKNLVEIFNELLQWENRSIDLVN